MRRMDWHLLSRVALFALGIQLALSQMVLLMNTLIILRPILGGALPASVFWDAYFGALPNVFYLTLPLSTAFALIFGYTHYAREHTLTVLYSAGISHWRIAAPGLAVAVGAALIGAGIAHVFAPLGAGRLEDAKHHIRADPPHRLLPESQFVDLVPSRLTIYFKAWIGPDHVSQITLFDRREEREQRVIDAKVAKFVREGRTLSIVLGPGNLYTFERSSGQARRIAFREFVTGYSLDDDPALASRPGPLFYVQSTAWLVSPPAEIRARAEWYRRSQAELHKRLATPFFVLAYAPLIVAIGLFMERTGRRASLLLGIAPLTVAGAHIGLIVLFETGVRSGPAVIFLGYAFLLALASAGTGLIQLHDSGQARGLAQWATQRLQRRARNLRYLSGAPVGDRAGERPDAVAAKAGGGGIT